MERKSDPTWLQFVLARGTSISTIGTIGTALVFLVWHCATCQALVEVGNLMDILSYLSATAAVTTGGAVFAWLIVRTLISEIASELNGAPFQNGDCVEILVGDYRGRRVLIYDLLEPFRAVRVDLGEQQKVNVTDVLRYCEVFRVGGEHRSIFEHRRNRARKSASK